MKLITSCNRQIKIEVLDFEKTIHECLMVHEYSTGGMYYCCFCNAETKDHHNACCLKGSCGYGSSIDEAIKSYCKEINGSHLVFRAMRDDRKEINLKNFELVHTKRYGIDYDPDVVEVSKY